MQRDSTRALERGQTTSSSPTIARTVLAPIGDSPMPRIQVPRPPTPTDDLHGTAPWQELPRVLQQHILVLGGNHRSRRVSKEFRDTFDSTSCR